MVADFSQRPSFTRFTFTRFTFTRFTFTRFTFTRFSSHVTCGVLLVCALWSSGCTPLIQPPTPVASAVEAADVRLIVQVKYPTVDVLNALAGELDVWAVDRTAQTFIARITLAQHEMLRQQALTVTLDCAKMEQYGDDIVAAATTAVADLLAQQCPKK